MPSPPKAILIGLINNLRMVVFDFDGVFTDNRVLTLQDGTEGVFCWRGDGLGLAALARLGIELLVLSKERNPVVAARCEKLGIACIQGCGDKGKALSDLVSKSGVHLRNVAYVGNDVNDLACLEMVGLPVCVRDSHPAIAKKCFYTTRARGGYGAVREFCDLIVKVRSKIKK